MKNITNFKLIDFLNQSPELIEEYILILGYVKPVSTERKIGQMKLKHVERAKTLLSGGLDSDLIKLVSKIQRISKEAVLDIDIIRFFGLLASVREQVQKIIEAEQNNLVPKTVNAKWEIVEGSSRMSKFGIYNTLEALTDKNAKDYKFYMNMNYDEVFLILLMRKEANDIQHDMNSIKTQ